MNVELCIADVRVAEPHASLGIEHIRSKRVPRHCRQRAISECSLSVSVSVSRSSRLLRSYWKRAARLSQALQVL